MTSAEYYRDRAASEQALVQAAAEHAQKWGASAFLMPVAGPAQTTFLAFGTADTLRALLEGVEE